MRDSPNAGPAWRLIRTQNDLARRSQAVRFSLMLIVDVAFPCFIAPEGGNHPILVTDPNWNCFAGDFHAVAGRIGHGNKHPAHQMGTAFEGPGTNQIGSFR